MTATVVGNLVDAFATAFGAGAPTPARKRKRAWTSATAIMLGMLQRDGASKSVVTAADRSRHAGNRVDDAARKRERKCAHRMKCLQNGGYVR